MAPTFKLMGGLGNQLFVYAAALFYANEFGKTMALDPQFAAGAKRGGRHHILSSSLERLHLDPRVKLAPRRDNSKNALLNLLCDVQLRLGGKRTVSFPTLKDSGGYGDIVSERALYVRGYFQRYDYLSSLKGQKEWTAPRPRVVDIETQELAQQIATGSGVVIHLRRGDYQRLENSFGLLSFDYYLKALERLETYRGRLGKVFVFSDDLGLVNRDFLPRLGKLYDIEAVKPLGSPDQDLFAMSHASNFVIANSSFSWWAANLGSDQEERKVVYPQPWFKESPFSNGLFPSHWIGVEAMWESYV